MDNFFFDNNIWIFLFCPIGNHDKNKQKIYSSFLQSVRQANATIWIKMQYLQLIIPQYFISNKSGIWSLSLIVHSKG